MELPQQINDFLKDFGAILKIEKLTSGGSGRIYHRIFFERNSKYKTLIFVENEDIKENETFVKFSFLFKKIGICVPEIVFFKKGKYYLQEDLGDTTLLSVVLQGKDCTDFYKKVLFNLAKLQTQGIKLIEKKDFYTYSSFNDMLIFRDLFYFKNYFLDFTSVKYKENELLKDFKFLAENISTSKNQYLMYRDLQGRNIMLKDDNPYFIDYQGAMLGPCVYDAVSLLWQAKANLSDCFRGEMLNYYYQSLSEFVNFREEEIQKDFQMCLVLRLLQVLGAYGKLGWIQKKSHFLESIRFGVENLKDLLSLEIIEKIPCIKDSIVQLQKIEIINE